MAGSLKCSDRGLLQNLFPDPDSILFLMGTDQAQFVGELNTLLLESLVGTEIDTTTMASTVTREDMAGCIRYRRGSGALSAKGRDKPAFPLGKRDVRGVADICGR